MQGMAGNMQIPENVEAEPKPQESLAEVLTKASFMLVRESIWNEDDTKMSNDQEAESGKLKQWVDWPPHLLHILGSNSRRISMELDVVGWTIV